MAAAKIRPCPVLPVCAGRGRRKRSQNVVASVKAARNEVVVARAGTTAKLSQVLEKAMEKNRCKQTSYPKCEINYGKAGLQPWWPRVAQPAARAAKATQRIRSNTLETRATRNNMGIQSRNAKSKTHVPAEGSSNCLIGPI